MTEDSEGLLPARTSQSLDGFDRAQHCVIFAVDVAGFTDVKRDDEVQLAVRTALYGLLIEAFDGAHLPWEECLHEDRGDGILVIIPAKMPSATVVDPLMERIRGGLRHHNRLASDAAAIRLRAAVHIGEVHSDAYGLAGSGVNHLFRLLDAPVLKKTLANAGADLALMVSDYFYDSVVKHGPGMIDPATFRPVDVEVKETKTRGWMHLPGVPTALSRLAEGQPGEAPDENAVTKPRNLYGTPHPQPTTPWPAPAQGFIFLGPTTIYGDVVAGHKIVNIVGEHPEPIESANET
jgi:class 3 adenylate cyclase